MFVENLPDEIVLRYSMILPEVERLFWFNSNDRKQIIFYTIPHYERVGYNPFKPNTLDGYMVITERDNQLAIETYFDRWVLSPSKTMRNIIDGKRLTLTTDKVLY